MFVILCYDVNRLRDPRIRKTVMKYLRPVQRSVFEGELTDKMLNHLKSEIERLIEPDSDSAVIYCMNSANLVRRQEIGVVTGKSSII